MIPKPEDAECCEGGCEGDNPPDDDPGGVFIYPMSDRGETCIC